ncbi:formate dehydrogenase accessory sulfurtransferase FdhD [Candidatus Poribacteria bacterium]
MQDTIEQTESRTIVRIDQDGRKAQEDVVAREHALTLTLNDRQFVTMLCSPSDLEALGLGFLLSEGVIQSREDVESLSLSEDGSELKIYLKDEDALGEELFSKRAITSGCGRGSIFYNILDALDFQEVLSDMKVSAASITRLAGEFQSMSTLYKSTGGTHAAALSDENEILVFRNDIGRHNAVDKVFGECLMREIEIYGKMLLTSGRISSEILLKSVRRGLAIVVSRSAPTGLAIEFAEKAGITLAGFVRGKRMNIYSNDHRIE